MKRNHKIEDYIIFQEDIYCQCACECFVRVQVNEWDWSKEQDGSELDRQMSVTYFQPNGSYEQWKFNKIRTRIKRAWLAIRNKDWLPGFEMYDTDSVGELALAIQKAAMVVNFGKQFPIDDLKKL